MFNTTNTLLENFFFAIENNDTSIINIDNKQNKTIQKLVIRFNSINKKINELRIKIESQNHFLKAIIENIDVGLLVIDKEGKIVLANHAFYRIFPKLKLNSISQFDKVNEGLSLKIKNLKTNEPLLIKIQHSGEIIPVSINCNELKIIDRFLKIISFQNIKNELEVQELDSWQRLIRVLTHEIMNSVSPITSTIDTISEFLQEENSESAKPVFELTQELINDTLRGVHIIKSRSIGLKEFVQNFRNLTLIPQLKPEKFQIQILFDEVSFLLKEKLSENQIEVKTAVFPKNLQLFADKKLIEQTILNLINNAIDALENSTNKIVQLKAFHNSDNLAIIQVIDNGKGIDEELADKIFIPFYTTKETGSGIGLSLARQIMRLHGGTITMQSEPNKETVFTLKF